MKDNLLPVRFGPVVENDDGVHRFPPPFAGDPDYGYPGDCGMRGNGVLNLHRVNVFPTGDDPVLYAIDQEQISLVIEVTGVPGVLPAPAERFSRRRRLVPIPGQGVPPLAHTSPLFHGGSRFPSTSWIQSSIPVTGRPTDSSR